MFRSQPLAFGLRRCGVLGKLPELPFDLGTLTIEGRCAFEPLRELFGERRLLGNERRQLPSLRSEALVQDRALLQRSCQSLFQFAKPFRIAIQFIDDTLMTGTRLDQGGFELLKLSLQANTGRIQLGNTGVGLGLPALVIPMTRLLFLEPAGQTTLLAAELP